ncbi:MAG: ABC transporter permease [Myxococcales bacterium]|nr:ABC transporter permease [Myxococcales bacterium]
MSRSAARDVWVVAGHELAEALRSRRVLILALLYVGGAVGGTLILIESLRGLEAMLAETLAVGTSERPGTFTQELMGSAQAQRFLARVLDDAELAAELVSIPPLSLFYGWLVLAFCPALVMLTASESVAVDLATGAARFSLVRTPRLSFSAGKFVGQAALLGVSILCGGVGVWVTGYLEFEGFEPLASAAWMLVLAGRGFIYCLAYVGLAVGLSHLTRSVPWSRALGLIALGVASALWGLAQLRWTSEHLGALPRALLPLLPKAHQSDLWRPEWIERAPAQLMLCALAVFYFSLGYRFRARRDT